VSRSLRLQVCFGVLGLLGPRLAAAAPAVRLLVSAPACVGICPGPVPSLTSVRSGQAFTIYVAAVDGSDLADAGYVGAVKFGTTDALGTLPSDFSFLPANQGLRVFADGAVLRTPGSQTITATDAAGILATGTLTLTVTPSVDRLVLSNSPCLISACPSAAPPAPTSVASGSPFSLYAAVFKVIDGNIVGPDGNYRGTVDFTSTDSLASLPASLTFGATDGGTRAFNGVVLRTPGSQTITGTDRANSLSGSLTLTVTGQLSVSVPMISAGMKALLALALASAGIYFVGLKV
jgi:hypothetical protein